MKLTAAFIIFNFTVFFCKAQQQKIVGDCTVTFSISSNQPSTNSNLAGATKTLYIKSMFARVDMADADYAQSIIYNSTTGEATILKQVANNKYISRFTRDKWKQKNSRYDGMKISFGSDTQTIANYQCKKAIATLKDGSSMVFFYTTAIMPSVTESPYEFEGIPGFVLEYQVMEEDKKSMITYTATKIDFSPVPESKFDIPSSGYRVLNN